jgi:invasion protein IalB
MLRRGEQKTERPENMQPPSIFRILLACAALALPGLALAQDTAEEDAAEQVEEQAAEAEEAPATDPALEAMQIGEPEGAETYLAATHRDWQVLCTRFEGEEIEFCEMYQLLETEDGPIAEITVQALPAAAGIPAGITVTTPLETFLLPGVGFRIDAGQTRQEPFFVCTVTGCVARLGLQEAEVSAMQRGANAVLTIVAMVALEEPIEIPVSLMGFTAGYEDLRARLPAE